MPRARRSADAWYWAMVDMWPRLAASHVLLYVREIAYRHGAHR